MLDRPDDCSSGENGGVGVERADGRPDKVVPPARPRITCRRMGEDDIEAVVAVLSRGFPERKPAYWRRGLQRLRERDVPDGYPRFGYVLSDHDRVVGVLLVIVARSDEGDLRGNVSSWIVEPDYRAYSSMLGAAPLRLGITLFNISPTPATLATIEAQGFRRYVAGTFHAVAALGAVVRGASVRAVRADDREAAPVLTSHAALGCLAFEVRTADGGLHPFVFVRRRMLGGCVPCAQLTYCRSISAFVQFAGPLGRRLLRHGLPLVMFDADSPVKGLTGMYRDGTRVKYARGPAHPRLGDLADTELMLLGP